MGDNRVLEQLKYILDDKMDSRQEPANDTIFDNLFNTESRSETNGYGTFTAHHHIHSKQNNSNFNLHNTPLANGAVQPINYYTFRSQQPTLATATTTQTLDMVSQIDQSAFRDQLCVSPHKTFMIPGLGQTGNTYQGYMSNTPASSQRSSASHQNVFEAADPFARPEFKHGYDQMANKSRHLTIKDKDEPSISKQQLQPQRNIMEDLKQLLEREIKSTSNKPPTTGASSTQSSSLSLLLPPHLEQHATISPRRHNPITALPMHTMTSMQASGTPSYQHADDMPLLPKPISPTRFTPPTRTPTKFNAPAQMPIKLNGKTPTPVKPNGQLVTPKKTHVPSTPRQSTGKTKGRHHRTATPEQRTIRDMMGGKPVFTMGMKEQDDRCLFFDFFQQIKQWATNYTVHLRSLNAEQIHGLATHAAIAGPLGEPSKLAMLVTEKDMLNAMVASIICRHVVTYALDEHSLRASGHPQADACEELVYRWTLLGANDHAAKHDLLLSQQQIYTTIKEAPDHRAWRAATASRLAFALLSSLSGLLATNLAPSALTERNHILTELYVKGYRIGFRLRMSASRWSFQWPMAGAEFEPTAMVNENRTLYGDILRTMTAVMNEPQAHEVRFAVSPTVARSDFGSGEEKRVVAHHAMVHITRKGCA
ncbi:hypothetical protein J1614_007006 [Plenodomus biglobosus]|nr:hypothetical protein J1614_007006 [Plenodomus biglobosus]